MNQWANVMPVWNLWEMWIYFSFFLLRNPAKWDLLRLLVCWRMVFPGAVVGRETVRRSAAKPTWAEPHRPTHRPTDETGAYYSAQWSQMTPCSVFSAALLFMDVWSLSSGLVSLDGCGGGSLVRVCSCPRLHFLLLPSSGSAAALLPSTDMGLN